MRICRAYVSNLFILAEITLSWPSNLHRTCDQSLSYLTRQSLHFIVFVVFIILLVKASTFDQQYLVMRH